MAKASAEAAAVVRVRIPSPLRSYTGGADEVRVAIPLLAPEHPPSLTAVLAALEGRYRGLRFRIIDEQGCLRPHVKVFVGGVLASHLGVPVPSGTEVMIVAALSGG
jgi:sulfur-carrier protein